MLGVPDRVLIVLAFVAATVTVGDATARTIRRSCRDGLMADRPPASCDVDGQCDGVCSFAIPVCATSTCQTETFTVPLRSTRRERIALAPGAAATTVVLRCRPRPRIARCVTVTTTTSGPSTTTPGHLVPVPTTTTIRRLVGPGSTSSTTTTTSCMSCPLPTSSTTSTIPVPCQTDADCDGLATACAVGFCGMHETCVQTCVCLTPELDRTCSLDAASPCLTPADCPAPDHAACLVCYLNLCVTAPAPACFF